jgi:hypothetical protein
MYELKLERRVFDNILYENDSSDIPQYLLQPVLAPYLWIPADSFCWSGNSSLFQIEFMSLLITDTNISPPAWYSSAEIWSLPGDLYFFSFAMEISNLRWLGPGTSGSAVCISIYLTSLQLCVFNNWKK